MLNKDVLKCSSQLMEGGQTQMCSRLITGSVFRDYSRLGNHMQCKNQV